MNLLRLIGQNTLREPDAPVRHAAKRRRIKTVMQELMFKAARMIRHAGHWVSSGRAGLRRALQAACAMSSRRAS